MNYQTLLKEADETVRGKILWKKWIDGTPLANDIPVWMAEFASKTIWGVADKINGELCDKVGSHQAAEAEAKVVIDRLVETLQAVDYYIYASDEQCKQGESREAAFKRFSLLAPEAAELAAEWKKQGGRDDE